MKSVLLLRHAKSSWDNPGLSDIERPLNERGKSAARKMGEWISQTFDHIDMIFCSPAERTQQTLELVLEFYSRTPDIHMEPALYGYGPGTYMETIRSAPDSASRIMLIGHNPSMAALAQDLAGTGAASDLEALRLKMPTAALAQIDFDTQSWRSVRKGAGRLIRFVKPKSLD